MTIDERASRSMSLSPSPRFGLNWQMEFLTELCSELNHGVIFGVGGHTECWGDGMCSEMRGGDIPSERVVEKGVPLHPPPLQGSDVSALLMIMSERGWCQIP